MTRRITSAYNFAPLAKQVVCPEWQDRVSHDLPLQDGLCAELDIELTAHTPLLVGAERRDADKQGGVQVVRFFTHPDGTPAIPGSSLRGMLRNVLEVATFSRLQLMDDRALSVRDLTSSDNEYMKRMVKGNIRSQGEGARAQASGGWLWFDGENWRLESTAVARVEQDEIRRHFGLEDRVWPRHDDTGRKKSWRVSAAEKYRVIREACTRNRLAAEIDRDGHIGVHFRLEADSTHRHSDGKYLSYKRVSRLLSCDAEKPYYPGVLVVTGQGIPTKHMDFVFGACARKPTARVLDSATMATFRQVYGHDNSDWNTHWAKRAGDGVPVPVFFLEVDGFLQVGLSQMFRLAGPLSLGVMASNKQVKRQDGRPLDFVETLFGHVSTQLSAAGEALKGRVSFGDLRWTPSGQSSAAMAKASFCNPTVLAQPKPSFYPAYLQQDGDETGVLPGGGQYRTVLSATAQLRGWKRYPVWGPGEVVECPAPPAKSKPDSQIALRPLAPGNRFTGRLRLHNVTREELGAVVWALTWGGDDKLRHTLGLGKPFGLGQVTIRIETGKGSTVVRANQLEAPTPSLDDCRAAFVKYMSMQVANWSGTDSLRELLAMADPARPQANRTNLTALQLVVGGGPGSNHFVAAKRDRSVLQRYSRMRS